MTTRAAPWVSPPRRRPRSRRPTARMAVTGARSRRTAPRSRGQPTMGGVAPVRVGQPALGLPHRPDVVVEPPLRPAPPDLGAVERLVGDALGGQAVGVVGHRDGRVGRPQVEAAGDGHDRVAAGLALDLGPGLVGALGEAHVVGTVVAQADDPAVVGRRAVGVAELEALEAEDAGVRPGRGPVGRGRAEGPESDDDDVPVATVHGHAVDPAPGSSYVRVSTGATMPPTATASGATSGSGRTRISEPTPWLMTSARPSR